MRIEILQSIENEKYRARIWDQHTYNLYPTFVNMKPEGEIENTLFNCDEINREVTTILNQDDPSDLFFGKEWDSEEDFLNHLKKLVEEYKH